MKRSSKSWGLLFMAASTLACGNESGVDIDDDLVPDELALPEAAESGVEPETMGSKHAAPSPAQGDALDAAVPPPDDAEGIELSKGPRFRTVERPVKGEYLVVYDPRGLASEDVVGVNAKLAAEAKAEVLFDYDAVIKGMAIRTSDEAARALAHHPLVAYVEESAEITPAGVGAGRFSTREWHLDRIDQREVTGDQMFYSPNQGSGVKIYILDTGVRSTHSEIAGRVEPGYTVASTMDDCAGHGTFVASMAAGKTVGVARAATIVPVRIADSACSISAAKAIAGLEVVYRNSGAAFRPVVVNLSFTTGATSALDDAVAKLVSLGATVVVAAGNDAKSAVSFSPARVNRAITVASIDNGDSFSNSFSNYGASVDILAPGSNIYGASNSGDTSYAPRSGTSVSASLVAGVAALYLSENPRAKPDTVASKLQASATSNAVRNLPDGTPNKLLYSAFNERPMLMGDFNGDGREDTLSINSDGAWVVGVSGIFGVVNQTFYADRERAFLVQPGIAGVRNMVGDFNGDGKSDFLYVSPADGSWWVGTSDGARFTFSRWFLDSGWGSTIADTSPTRTFVGDFNGDRRDDFLMTTSDGSWWVGLAQSAGTFSFSRWYQNNGWASSIVAGSPLRTFVADFTGDGRHDFLFTSPDGNIWLGESTQLCSMSPGSVSLAGDLTAFVPSCVDSFNFQLASQLPSLGNALNAQSQARVLLGDFNNDRRSDFVVINTDGGLWTALASTTSTGGRTFSVSQWGTAPQSRSLIGDFDNDGRSDILFLNATSISLKKSLGASFGASEPFGVPPGSLTNMSAVPWWTSLMFAGDMNESGAGGRSDLLVFALNGENYRAVAGSTGLAFNLSP